MSRDRMSSDIGSGSAGDVVQSCVGSTTMLSTKGTVETQHAKWLGWKQHRHSYRHFFPALLQGRSGAKSAQAQSDNCKPVEARSAAPAQRERSENHRAQASAPTQGQSKERLGTDNKFGTDKFDIEELVEISLIGIS